MNLDQNKVHTQTVKNEMVHNNLDTLCEKQDTLKD